MHIVWPQHFGWLKIPPSLLLLLVLPCCSVPFSLLLLLLGADLRFGPGNLFNTESTKAAAS